MTSKWVEAEDGEPKAPLVPQTSSFNADIPKRPLSPYIFYSQEVSSFRVLIRQQRQVLKRLHPTWSTKQVMKFLSKAWKSMSEEEKDRYKQISDQDRSRFDTERKVIKSSKATTEPCNPNPEKEDQPVILSKRSRELKRVNYGPAKKEKLIKRNKR